MYEAFAKNVSPLTVEEVVSQYSSESHAIGLIDYELNWEETDEGFNFWDQANCKFIQWFNSDEQTEQPSEDEQANQSSNSVQSSDRWIFDRGSKEAPFYMVYAEGKSSPTFKHGLMEEATKEADRLAYDLIMVKRSCNQVVLLQKVDDVERAVMEFGRKDFE